MRGVEGVFVKGSEAFLRGFEKKGLRKPDG